MLDWLLQREWWQILMMWCAIGYVLTMFLAYFEPDEDRSSVINRKDGEWAVLACFCSIFVPIYIPLYLPGKIIKFLEIKGHERKELKELKKQ